MREQLYVLGTGNAGALNCYNTCFALRDGDDFLLTDAGGGNGILRRLRDAEIPLPRIRDLIVTHAHTDHILGVIWVIRMIADAMRGGAYEGALRLYGHDEVMKTLRTLCELTLQKKHLALFDSQILFETVSDGETRRLGRYDVTFFDIRSDKLKQYGFTLRLHNGRRLTCLGDEPYNALCRPYAEGADWLLSEAFCLYGEREIFRPYEKHHSTAADAAALAETLGVKNLVLWHTEDTDLANRKRRYSAEAAARFTGNIFVPDDSEILDL